MKEGEKASLLSMVLVRSSCLGFKVDCLYCQLPSTLILLSDVI